MTPCTAAKPCGGPQQEFSIARQRPCTEERSERPRQISILLLIACVLLLPSAMNAQFRASLQGTIEDQTGAVIPGASVTLLNTANNQKLETTSDGAGIYHFNALPPSTYELTVDLTGFKQKILKNVNIIPEQANALDVVLEIGQVQEAVTVNDATPPIDTATANIAGTIGSNQVQNMPSFGRDVFKLVQLAPGIMGDNSQAAGGGGFSLPGSQGPGATGGKAGIFQTENGPQALAAGQQYENNSYAIDGVNTTSAVWGGTTIITPTKESVQDVKVLSNAYDAENGRYSGAQVQVTTKSGTDKYHGSFSGTFHRPGLNAYQKFNGQGNKPLRDNNFFTQLGGSVGGPIPIPHWKNRLYAFFAYETTRNPKGQVNTNNGWYETPAFMKLAPTGSISAKYLGFPGATVDSVGINASTCANAGLSEGVNCRTIPGQGLDIGSPLQTPLGSHDLGWTSPSNPGVGGGLDGIADIANYVTQNTETSSASQYVGRLDADITSKDRLSYSMYWVPTSKTSLNGPDRAYNLFHHSQTNDAFTLIWNRTLSPTLLNEARFNAAGWRWNEVTSNPQSPVGLPSDYIDTIGSINLSKFGPSVGSILNQWTYAFKDVATKVWGRHQIKFGGDVTRLFYLNAAPYNAAPHYNFFNLWDFLNDAPHVEGGTFDPNTGAPTMARQDDRQVIWGLFAQDDFKLRRNLTLNLGLRYNYFGALSSKQGNMFVAIPGSGSSYMTGLTVQRGHSWDPQKTNFGPQIGFAWSPSYFSDKLVVRGGYGLNYNQMEIALSANVANNPGLITQPTFSMATPTSANPGILYAVSADVHSLNGYPANPNAVFQYGSNGLPANGTAVNVVMFPRDFPTLRVHHYSLQTEYTLPKDWVVSLGYQGSISKHLVFHKNPNAAPAALGYALNTQIGGGDIWDMNGEANYNAMLLQVRHQFAHQFMVDAQYTWSKSMDTASGPYYENPFAYRPSLNWGPSDYNAGNVFKIFGMWQPKYFSENTWLGKIADDWTLSGILNIHTGFPWSPVVSVQGGSLYCGTCGYTTLYPAAYLGGAGSDYGTDQYKTGSNFPKGGQAYFTVPAYTAYAGSNYGSALPQTGLHRNAIQGPPYKSLDLSLAKAVKLPKAPVLGEGANIEVRADAYNVLNNLNMNPSSISNNIANANFGQATSALSGRVVTLGARFQF